MRASMIAALALALAGLTACEPADSEPDASEGSLCACRELDGVRECCFGHGACEAQAEGPARCVCDPGARGETCSTPAPGVHAVRPRTCEGDDPGCVQAHAFVAVEHLDSCVDLEGQRFESVIVRPAVDAEGSWPAQALPVAVLTHGASQDPADYYDLLEHVAANGVVIAAFDGTPGRDITFRANRLLVYLECLRGEWPEAARLEDRYALIGHSRGGAAVALAAEAIADGIAGEGVEVEAIVALAPTRTGQRALSPAATPAYFTLQGARDPETPGASLAWFDLARAGDPERVNALAWIHGATHQRFHQGLLAAGSGELEASLDAEGHWSVARAYIGGFLMWRLLGREGYRELFTGERVPASVAASWVGEPGVFAGLSDGAAARRALLDFEGDTIVQPGGGPSLSLDGFAEATGGELAQLDAPWSTGNLSRGLGLRWSAGASPVVRVELPAGLGDLRDYAALSLRVGRGFDGAQGCSPTPVELPVFGLRLFDAEGEAELRFGDGDLDLGEAGRIPAADRFAPQTFGAWIRDDCHAIDYLRPVRLPLTRFCEAGVDLSAVTAIELRISDVDGAGGALLVDDLALERGEGELGGCG
ncbi:hypothetical protein G6O69_16005 [Pseudenhygromyxa sp. WMMC2535]|uniref:hypothetical protein n=1 Tax=Pseudenhygromyxa sp. WMMC2535 TaxID=2712867 RepID=UPI00155432E6|nr:hypothetical protein [Pseudenhygromyxa sp. WMMC2535]NVB39347.1 hypothetical protein [Pseudenhygromyxa sp. WMMC2535]